MPLIPSAGVTVNTTPPADVMIPVDKTLTVANTPEDFATIVAPRRGRTIAIVNMGPGKAYIRADADADTNVANSLPLEVGDSYSDENLGVLTRWSFVGATGQLPRLRGVVWSGMA